MTLVKFEPYRGFEKLMRRFNEFSDEFDKGLDFEYGGFNPRVDITEDDNHLFVHAELPGMSKEQVKVSVNDDRLLTIKGEKDKTEKSEDKKYIRYERKFGSFSRSFVLPENVDIEKIDAKFENGVLELSLNKIEPAKPKEIEVSIN